MAPGPSNTHGGCRRKMITCNAGYRLSFEELTEARRSRFPLYPSASSLPVPLWLLTTARLNLGVEVPALTVDLRRSHRSHLKPAAASCRIAGWRRRHRRHPPCSTSAVRAHPATATAPAPPLPSSTTTTTPAVLGGLWWPGEPRPPTPFQKSGVRSSGGSRRARQYRARRRLA